MKVQKIQSEFEKSLLVSQITRLEGYGTEEEFELSGQSVKMLLDPGWINERNIKARSVIRVVSPFIMWRNTAEELSIHDPFWVDHLESGSDLEKPEEEIEEIILQKHY